MKSNDNIDNCSKILQTSCDFPLLRYNKANTKVCLPGGIADAILIPVFIYHL